MPLDHQDRRMLRVVTMGCILWSCFIYAFNALAGAMSPWVYVETALPLLAPPLILLVISRRDSYKD